MSAAFTNKERTPFFKVVRRGATKTFTFLGVPANSILIMFAVILLILNVFPFISLFLHDPDKKRP